MAHCKGPKNHMIFTTHNFQNSLWSFVYLKLFSFFCWDVSSVENNSNPRNARAFTASFSFPSKKLNMKLIRSIVKGVPTTPKQLLYQMEQKSGGKKALGKCLCQTN